MRRGGNTVLLFFEKRSMDFRNNYPFKNHNGEVSLKDLSSILSLFQEGLGSLQERLKSIQDEKKANQMAIIKR